MLLSALKKMRNLAHWSASHLPFPHTSQFLLLALFLVLEFTCVTLYTKTGYLNKKGVLLLQVSGRGATLQALWKNHSNMVSQKENDSSPETKLKVMEGCELLLFIFSKKIRIFVFIILGKQEILYLPWRRWRTTKAAGAQEVMIPGSREAQRKEYSVAATLFHNETAALKAMAERLRHWAEGER